MSAESNDVSPVMGAVTGWKDPQVGPFDQSVAYPAAAPAPMLLGPGRPGVNRLASGRPRRKAAW